MFSKCRYGVVFCQVDLFKVNCSSLGGFLSYVRCCVLPGASCKCKTNIKTCTPSALRGNCVLMKPPATVAKRLLLLLNWTGEWESVARHGYYPVGITKMLCIEIRQK